MRTKLAASLVLLWLSGCGAGDDDPMSFEGGDANVMLGNDAALPGGGATGGAVDAGTFGGPGGTTGGAPAGSGGAPGVGADAGAPGGGPSDSGSVMTSGPEPVIPKPSMACPTFQSGMATIMGLSVNVYAGAKSTGAKGPLLFYWHGTNGNGAEAERTLPAAVRNEIMQQGGIIIAPTTTTAKGSDVTFFLGVWYTPGDFEFADLIAACAVENHNIDPRRIYTTGCSAGGLMAAQMAFHRSSYLAASVPNSGGVAAPGLDMFTDAKHIPALMTMHGNPTDDNVFIVFADSSKTAYTSLARAGGFAVNCDHTGGHCAARAELQTAGWQFMKDHPFGVSPEPYANGLPASFPSYCKIIPKP